MKACIYSIFLLLTVALFACNNPAPSTPSNTQAKVQDKGVNIAYTDNGTGDTTLLFVHGWDINKSYWSNQVKYFSKNYRVITIDLPGYGQSGKNRNSWTVHDFGRDVDSVIDQLNLNNVVLVGHSMSGSIIVDAATHARDKIIALVGVDNFLGFGKPKDSKSKDSYNDAIAQLKKDYKGITHLYFNQDLFYKTTPDSIKKRILNDVDHSDPKIAIATMEHGDYDDEANLPLLKKTLYLINSDIHPTYRLGFEKNNVPYELKEIHATGHFPMVEKPAEFNVLLAQILADIKTNSK
jgi:pimeloyl-ACP methyl ester carboxylesterase